MREEWRPVVGYEGYYEVSNLGKVRRLDGLDARGHHIKGRILSPRKSSNGYLQVQLSFGTSREYRIHRLVAEAFLPNPKKKSDVNHINENKTDNRVENLEWATRKENMRHGTLSQRMRDRPPEQGKAGAKKVQQIDLKTGAVIAEYPSAAEAERQTGIKAQNISQCRNRTKNYRSAGGYGWK